MKNLDFNSLEVQNLGWRKQTNPLPKSKKISEPMTQIVGIVYSEGILIASESQYTADQQKTFDAEKISIIQLNGNDLIIAECGIPSVSNRAVRYIKDAVKDIKIDSEDSISRVIEGVINKIREEILEGYAKRPYSDSELDEIFSSDRLRFGLMFAHYFKPPRKDPLTNPGRLKPIPCLYKITLRDGLSERIHSYGVMGAVDRLAVFILKQFKCSELIWGEAACLAVDALEKITDDDSTCGGDIVFAILNPSVLTYPVAIPYGGDELARIRSKLKVMRAQNDARYKSELGKVMNDIQREDYEKYVKPAIEAEENRQNLLRMESAKNNPVTGKVGKSTITEIKSDEKI